MRTFLSRLAAVVVLLSPLAATAQDASLDQVAKAMGAAGVKSIQYSGQRRELSDRPELQPGHAVAAVHRQELHPRGELRERLAPGRAGADAG